MTIVYFILLIAMALIALACVLHWFRVHLLKTVDRSEGALPRFLGDNNWPAFPQSALLNAKRDVISSPLYIVGFGSVFLFATSFHELVLAKFSPDIAYPARLAIVIVVAMVVGSVFQYLLGLQVRKRAEAATSQPLN